MTAPGSTGAGPERPDPAGDPPNPSPAGARSAAPRSSAPGSAAPRPSAPEPPAPLSGEPQTSDPQPADPRTSGAAVAHAGAGDPDELACAAAAALAEHVADRAAPRAEFGCGNGAGGVALARAGFTTIDGFDPVDESLAEAARPRIYRRLARAEPAALAGIEPGVYANAAAIGALDPDRTPPQALDALLALLPPGGCLVITLPGGGASVCPFRARVLELCEHFVAEPVFRAAFDRAPGQHRPGHPPERDLQSTLFVLKKR